MASRTNGTPARKTTARKRPAPSASASPRPSPTPPLSTPPLNGPSGISNAPVVNSPVAVQRIVRPMHNISGVGPNIPSRGTSVTIARTVPAFLNKLYNMVNEPATDDLIYWGPDGTTFIVQRQEDFARDVLPRFFKHNNFASFVRQLNMYGFHKIPHLQQGVLQSDGEPEIWEFTNPNFQRNQPDLLCLVTRKKGRDHGEEKDATSMDMNYIIQEIAAIKRHQMTISTDLSSIQRENQVLWSESVAIRDRYQRQQETIDKILRFLASVFTQKKKPLMNKKRRLLLGNGIPSGVDEDEEEILPDTVSQRVRDLIEPPLPSTNVRAAPTSSLTVLSPTTGLDNLGPLPDLNQQLIAQNQNINDIADAANNVSDDIDLLQDHLTSISEQLGLDSLDNLGDYDLNNYLGSEPSLDGTEEDRQTLLALMRHNNPSIVSNDYFNLPNQSISAPTAPASTAPTAADILAAARQANSTALLSTIPAPILATMPNTSASIPASIPPTSAQSASTVGAPTNAFAEQDPTLLPPLDIDDLQNGLLNGELGQFNLPDNMDPSEFDFLNG